MEALSADKNYHTYLPSPMGIISIHASEAAIQSIRFEEDDFVIPPSNENMLTRKCRSWLEHYFAGRIEPFELPLLQKGTEFQQKIWSMLMNIPFGKTISYQRLSQQFGDPKAIRAVAAANGKNDIAIVVPCHRVIGSNGSLTGYAGGLPRKKWLLEHEAKHAGLVRMLFP